MSLERGLLARQTDEQIAVALGVTAAVIGFYAAACFDVCDRLAARDFIVHQVIAPDRIRQDAAQWCDALWKMTAYVGGVALWNSLCCGATDRRCVGVAGSWRLRPQELARPSEGVSKEEKGGAKLLGKKIDRN